MNGSPLIGWITWYVGLSAWMALMVKECVLVGMRRSGEAERPLGEIKALVLDEAKLELSWLAMGEVAVAMAAAFASAAFG